MYTVQRLKHRIQTSMTELIDRPLDSNKDFDILVDCLTADHVVKEGINHLNCLNVKWFFRIEKYAAEPNVAVSDIEQTQSDVSLEDGSDEHEQQMARMSSILRYFDCVEIYWGC